MLSTQAQQWVLKTWTEEVRRREEALEDCAEEKQSSDQRSAISSQVNERLKKNAIDLSYLFGVKNPFQTETDPL